jgi:hypothetical protein
MQTHKELNRVFWLIKGQLIPESWTKEVQLEMYDEYFKRLWCDNEQYQWELGFEEAYNKRYNRTG